MDTDHGRAYGDDWRRERFISTIQERARVSPEVAERAARATLETLARRISRPVALELAEVLPPDLRAPLESAPERPETFHVEELVRRVAEREGVPAEEAARHARAVFVALARIAPHFEYDDLVADLPQEFEPFAGDIAARIRASGRRDPLSANAFLDRVARRAGLDRPAAQRATEAVLETLAERITGGEVDHAAVALPEELRPPLELGKARTGGNARRMSLDEFIARVAEREGEGVDFEDALHHARAVFETLGEVLPPKEVSDILSQVPRAYQETLLV
jgi:uncharacterized protein (DUF2267 family)